ncbi:hypothetical protein PR202_gb03690 [Eleusine coracana subsp. coracana]|uniref:CRM domain-containing protein n=1 Tax=Eleusine coracana subsp. coracana TaxID=191504 RepID=A0AAV5E2E2_ELECO|nr:hypothetical protein PR202_gb03690 [Eleusine coracana subsp. coracana]
MHQAAASCPPPLPPRSCIKRTTPTTSASYVSLQNMHDPATNLKAIERVSEATCKKACLDDCKCLAAQFVYGAEPRPRDGSCYLQSEVFSLQTSQPEVRHYNSTVHLKSGRRDTTPTPMCILKPLSCIMVAEAEIPTTLTSMATWLSSIASMEWNTCSPHIFLCHRSTVLFPSKCLSPLNLFGHSWAVRWASYGQVNLVLSDNGKPKFQIEEVDPSKKRRYLMKKRLKVQRKREKKKRKEANKNDPRRIRPKGKKIKQKFPTAEARLKYKIEKVAKLKEAMLVKKLKKYEVAKAEGPMSKPDDLTGEERFYLKKVSQKKSNYVPVGRRGVFGAVILNMHLHWKKHESVKVICKPCKPGQMQEYANEIARLSGGISFNIIGDDTIVFYRGKNYVQPDVMSPIDTLSKKKYVHSNKLVLHNHSEFISTSNHLFHKLMHLKNQNMSNRWRQLGVSLQCQKSSSNFIIGMLHFMEFPQSGVNYGHDRKASLLEVGELNQGKEQESQLATSDFSDLPISDISESDEDNLGS